MKKIDLCDMTWIEIKEAIAENYYRVIIPVASIEQHGYQLPENTDTVLGEAAARLVAETLGNTLVAPSIRPGISPHHMAMPGTLTFRPETLKMVLEDYISCYLAHGFREIVLLISHGGNVGPCLQIAEEMGRKHPQAEIYAVKDVPGQDELREMEAERGLPPGTNGGHADERETSEMLSLKPENVSMDKAECGYCKPLDSELLSRFFSEGVTALSETGCVGDPRPATADAGIWYRRRAAEALCKEIMNHANEKRSEKQ